MNTLLVYPNVTRSERYGGRIAIFGGRQIPLGIFYLASYLRRRGHQVHAVDAEAQNVSVNAVVELLGAGGFGALGISATTAVFHRAVELARSVKTAFPHLPVIIGGPHVTALPEDSLCAGPFDYAVCGEGEQTLCGTVEMIEAGGDAANVAGLAYRRDGRVKRNPPRVVEPDLDTFPFPAYDLIPDLNVYNPPPFNYRERPVANIITARGCPNECTFCASAAFGRTLRTRSPENVVAEIELLVRRFHVREIAIVDDTFTILPHRVYEIFDLVCRRGLKFPWSCKSRVNTVDEQLLRYMKRHGCWHIGFGIESGDEEILRGIRKNIRLSEVENVVDVCRRIGIVTKGFFMAGHPRETAATLERSIRFAIRLPLDQVAVSINTPLPGTHQFQHAEENGSLDRSSWSEFTFWRPVFVPFGLTRHQLVATQRAFLRRFYLRPRWLLRQAYETIKRPGTLIQVWRLLCDLARFQHSAGARSAR